MASTAFLFLGLLGAIAILAVTPQIKKKNLRVLIWPELAGSVRNRVEVRTILGGFLVQNSDGMAESIHEGRFDGASQSPWGPELLRTADVAWTACAHLKSNAISLAAKTPSGFQTVGMGMGQVNRVDAVNQAIERFQKFHPDSQDVVLASDAFFPFRDNIDLANGFGIKAILQPGGSIKDQEVIDACDEFGIAMAFSGRRHFRH